MEKNHLVYSETESTSTTVGQMKNKTNRVLMANEDKLANSNKLVKKILDQELKKYEEKMAYAKLWLTPRDYFELIHKL